MAHVGGLGAPNTSLVPSRREVSRDFNSRRGHCLKSAFCEAHGVLLDLGALSLLVLRCKALAKECRWLRLGDCNASVVKVLVAAHLQLVDGLNRKLDATRNNSARNSFPPQGRTLN